LTYAESGAVSRFNAAKKSVATALGHGDVRHMLFGSIGARHGQPLVSSIEGPIRATASLGAPPARPSIIEVALIEPSLLIQLLRENSTFWPINQ